MIERLGARAIAMILFGVFVVGLLIFGVSQCQQKQSAKTQEKVSKGQAGASIASGSEAINTVGNLAASDDATDGAVAAGQADIRAAVEGQKGKAAKAAACKLKTYRDTPQCKEQTP